MSLMTLREKVLEWFYPGIVRLGLSPYDGTRAFYSPLNALLPDHAVLLDYGAGRGASITANDAWQQAMLHSRPKVIRRIGCDVDPVVLENPFLDEAHVLTADTGYRLPLADDSVDAVVLDWVVEHLPDPVSTFADIHRVLRPGGRVFLRTPNRFHYSYMIAAMLDGTALEKKLLHRAQAGRAAHDVFPKLYRANSRWALRRALRQAGFADAVLIGWEPESGYLNFNAFTAIFGGVYQRLAMVGLLPCATWMAFALKRRECHGLQNSSLSSAFPSVQEVHNR